MSLRRLFFCLFFPLLLTTLSAHAAFHTFDFIGTGVHGTTASGSFTVDDPEAQPGYIGDGTIFTNFTLTLTNVPGGPGTFSLTNHFIGATYFVDLGGTPHIRPSGQSPATGGFVYRVIDLDGDGMTTPLRSTVQWADSATNQLLNVDTITWSPAVEEVAAVPEPTTYAAASLGALTIIVSRIRRRFGKGQLVPTDLAAN